jgi:hypothetical protein
MGEGPGDGAFSLSPGRGEAVYRRKRSGTQIERAVARSTTDVRGVTVEHGPVDVIILATGEPRFDGSVLAELERLSGAGMIRVLDAMILLMDENGDVLGLDMEDLPEDEKAALGFIETGTRGMFDAEDSATLAEGMVPGSVVVALAIEHVWATKLTEALYNTGAEVAVSFRVPAPVVSEAYAALSGS